MNSAQPDYESVMEMGGLVWTTGFHQRWATSRLISNCSIRQARARSDVLEPATLEDRRRIANGCMNTLFEAKVPVLVDTMDDRVSTMYTAKPTRIYLIGDDGRVVYNPGIGPFGYNPVHLGREIETYLAKRAG